MVDWAVVQAAKGGPRIKCHISQAQRADRFRDRIRPKAAGPMAAPMGVSGE
jgi:hypothetical protein